MSADGRFGNVTVTRIALRLVARYTPWGSAAEPGETAREGFRKCGPAIAANIRRSRPRPSDHWHLDEMVISIRGGKYWLWRAVDNEGEVLDFLVQRTRDAQTAKKLMVKSLKKHGFAPSRV